MNVRRVSSGREHCAPRLLNVGVSALSVLWAIAAPRVAHATYYMPSNVAAADDFKDDGLCSLREAVQASTTMASVNTGDCVAGSNDDTIFLGAGTWTVSTELAVSKRLAVISVGVASATVITTTSNFSKSQLFKVNASGDLSLTDVTLQNGNSSANIRGVYGVAGASVELERMTVAGFTNSGVYMADGASGSGGSLSLTQATIRNNSTTSHGGGLFVGSNVGLFVKYSTINDNAAVNRGGGIYFRGWGNNNINYTTLTANSAARGGGFYNQAEGSGGNYVSMLRVTIAGNSATTSGGGVVEEQDTGNSFGIANCIIAENTAPSNPNLQGEAVAWDNVFGTVTPGFVFHTGSSGNLNDVTSAQLKLGPLLDMGGWFGSQKVRPLLDGSVAIDRFAEEEPEGKGDQRKIDVQDYVSAGTYKMDAGAYEANRIFESEMLRTVSATDMVEDDALDEYSGHRGMVFHADAVGDNAIVPMYFAESGSYTVLVRIKRDNYGGLFKIGTSSSPTTGFSDFLPILESFVAGNQPTWTVYSLGTRNFNAGKYYFRYKVTGRSGGSLGYNMYADYIRVTKN